MVGRRFTVVLISLRLLKGILVIHQMKGHIFLYHDQIKNGFDGNQFIVIPICVLRYAYACSLHDGHA